jgi:nicotinate-nucleotide pyrophosphorylase (carboxylating)
MPPTASRTRGDELALVRRALEEDRFRSDRTTRGLLPRPLTRTAYIIAQARGTVSGVNVVARAVRDEGLTVRRLARDGATVRRGTPVLALTGDARRILAVERTVLNVLMHASGVATATAAAVRAVDGRLAIWATRKTLPGLRDLEKAAVVHGGGHPHRRDLSDAVLVKNNHLALVPLETAIGRLRRRYGPREPIEVEVRTAHEALVAARAGVPWLLLDNTTPQRAKAIVRQLERAGLRRGRILELSGGITPENVGRYAGVGADAASLGSLTHSARALPFHLRWAPSRLSRRAN